MAGFVVAIMTQIFILAITRTFDRAAVDIFCCNIQPVTKGQNLLERQRFGISERSKTGGNIFCPICTVFAGGAWTG